MDSERACQMKMTGKTPLPCHVRSNFGDSSKVKSIQEQMSPSLKCRAGGDLHLPLKMQQRISVNNNDILGVMWDITCLYPKGLSQSLLLCGITGNGF